MEAFRLKHPSPLHGSGLSDIRGGGSHDKESVCTSLGDAGLVCRGRAVCSCLEAHAMLQIVPLGEMPGHSPGQFVVFGASMVMAFDPTCVDMLIDATHQVLDAKHLWSPMRLQEMLPQITIFATKMCDAMLAIEMVFVHHAHLQLLGLVNSLQHNAGSGPGLTPSSYDTHQDWALIGQWADDILKAPWASSQLVPPAWTEKMCKLPTVLQNFARAIGDAGMESIVAEACRQLHINQVLSESFGSMWMQAARMTTQPLPDTTKGMVDEWLALGSGSFLSKAVSLLNTMSSVRDEGIFEFGFSACTMSASVFVSAGPGPKVDNACVAVDMANLSEFPAAVVDLPIFRWLVEFVGASSGCVAQAFATSCGLEAVLAPPTTADFSAKPMRECIEDFIKPDLLSAIKAPALQKFRQSFSESLPPGSAFSIVQEVWKHISFERVELHDPLMLSCDKAVPKDEAHTMIDLSRSVPQVIAVMIFLYEDYDQNVKFLKNHVAREELILALEYAETAIKDFTDKAAAEANMIESINKLSVPWRIPFHHMRGWLRMVFAFIKEVRGRLLAAAVNDMDGLASAVSKRTPKYDHFLNDKSMARSLVRKHLLQQGKVRTALATETVALFRSMSQVGKVSTMFGLPDPRQDERFKLAMENADSVYGSAKSTLAVIAGCNLLLDVSGPNQVPEISAFLARSDWKLPKALRSELEQVVSAQLRGSDAGPLVGSKRSAAELSR